MHRDRSWDVNFVCLLVKSIYVIVVYQNFRERIIELSGNDSKQDETKVDSFFLNVLRRKFLHYMYSFHHGINLIFKVYFIISRHTNPSYKSKD